MNRNQCHPPKRWEQSLCWLQAERVLRLAPLAWGMPAALDTRKHGQGHGCAHPHGGAGWRDAAAWSAMGGAARLPSSGPAHPSAWPVVRALSFWAANVKHVH